jgi:RNA-directed DNA polymerase
VISPLLSNLYLNEVDRMLEKAVDTTRRSKSTNVQYARFADDMVILIDAERRSDWLVKAINRRLREEFAKLRVEINEDKSRMVDLKKGESFTFLGFEYRRVLSLQRKWRPYYAPKLKKRTALFEKLREVFRKHVSWPVEIVIAKINPILRGWVNYFRVGHSSICFGVVKRWVEEKVRRHGRRNDRRDHDPAEFFRPPQPDSRHQGIPRCGCRPAHDQTGQSAARHARGGSSSNVSSVW